MSEERDTQQTPSAWERLKQGWQGADDPEELEARRQQEEARREARRQQRDERSTERFQARAENERRKEEQQHLREYDRYEDRQRAYRQRYLGSEERVAPDALLEAAVYFYVARGYRVTHRTATTVQMVRPKHFSFGWALLWLLVFGVGLLVYFIYYLGKKEQTVYLAVDEDGDLDVLEST